MIYGSISKPVLTFKGIQDLVLLDINLLVKVTSNSYIILTRSNTLKQ